MKYYWKFTNKHDEEGRLDLSKVELENMADEAIYKLKEDLSHQFNDEISVNTNKFVIPWEEEQYDEVFVCINIFSETEKEEAILEVCNNIAYTEDISKSKNVIFS
ncbi:MAG: hypothetical protein IE916_00455 [Epsilonproteobacteria bacterium]|nr:hypothetical protein [Campylobacterota bacterium]